jgi:hypothetical protein
MNGERQRHSRPVRLPRRPTDRVEDVAAWVLTVLGALTAVLAVMTGVRLHDEEMHRIGLETRERMQVQAVLLEPANPNAAGERPPRVRVVPVPTSIRYLTPDGAEHVADVPMTGAVPAGRAVPLWVDRSGQVVGAPGRAADAVGRAAVSAVGIALIGALILGGSWAGVRAVTRRVNTARWEREWMQVEPRWSGRTRS